MKNFFHFLKGDPKIHESKDIRSKIKLTVLMLPALFLVILFSSLLQMLFFRWGIIEQVKSSGMIPAYMKSMSPFRVILEIAVLAPFLEETAFRGSLQRHPGWFRVALFSLLYLIICRIAGLNFYELSLPTAVVLFAATLSLLIPKKTIFGIVSYLHRFPNRVILIWCSAFAFGFWHYYNFDFSQADFLTIIVCLLPFVLNGLLLSYIAIKNGLLWSIILHVLNNVWPLILWF